MTGSDTTGPDLKAAARARTTERTAGQSRTLRHPNGRKGQQQRPKDGKAEASPDAVSGGATAGSAPDVGDDLKSLPLAEVEKRLDSSPKGLTQAEAAKRLARYGPNEIETKKSNQLLKLLGYFWGPIPWMIEAAVILSAVLGHWPDFFVILVLLGANAGVGFWEERQAGKAVDALKAELATKARVRRDGTWVTPPSRELVPGDVIRLRLGDIVPADARLLGGDPVEIDQSALTGESLPTTRNRRCCVRRFDRTPR